MKRIPEPDDLMDNVTQARAYAETDFSEPRLLFQEHFSALSPGGFAGRMLDLGCGPADIPIALAQQFPDLHIDAVDGAESMLAHARSAIKRDPDLAKRIRLIRDYLPSENIDTGVYDVVVSNSLLHHLKDPAVLWQTAIACGRPGAALCVMDLQRPEDEETLGDLVHQHAADAPDVLRRDFRNSLFAAYRVDEVRSQLASAGLHKVEVKTISDRHLLATGFLQG